MTKHIATADRKFVVCPTCEGNGTHGPGHVYTQDDIDEIGWDNFDDMMEDYRNGVYDVLCETCHGKRVVKADCECPDCEADRLEIADMEAMERAERAFGC